MLVILAAMVAINFFLLVNLGFGWGEVMYFNLYSMLLMLEKACYIQVLVLFMEKDKLIDGRNLNYIRLMNNSRKNISLYFSKFLVGDSFSN